MNFNEGVVSIATLHDKITKQLEQKGKLGFDP